jgi:predicted RNase H-like HicB family nuclease
MNGWTAVYIETESCIIGYIEEMPGAHAQGATIEETEPRLREALELMLRANRRTTWEDFKGARVVKRERFRFVSRT